MRAVWFYVWSMVRVCLALSLWVWFDGVIRSLDEDSLILV
jgi:hypothetical protein